MSDDWFGAIMTVFVLIPVILGAEFGMICMYVIAPLTAIVIALGMKNDFGSAGMLAIVISIAVLWILVGIGSFFGGRHLHSDDTERTVHIIAVVLGVIALVSVIYAFVHTGNVEAKRRAEFEARETKKKQEKQEMEERFRTNYGEETDHYHDVGIDIRVFGKTRTLVFYDRPYSFDDIMWCHIDEEEIFTPGYKSTNVTARNPTGSVLKGALITGLTGNLAWGMARAMGDVDIESTTTVVPDSYKSRYTVTIAMFDKDRADHKKEYTFTTYNEERAENLRKFIERIQDDYRFEDENEDVR